MPSAHGKTGPGKDDAGAVVDRATVSDIPALLSLIQSAYRGESSRAGWTTEADLLDGSRTDAAALREVLDAPDSLVLVVREPLEGGDASADPAAVHPTDTAADAVLACCQLERRPPGSAYFGLFAVRPDRQSAGLGRRLMDAAETLARVEWRAAAMEMTVIAQRADLIAWYRRRGYEPTGETRPFPYGDVRFGIPRRPDLHFVVLRKPLS